LFNCYKCDFHTGNYDVFDFVAITEDIPRGLAVLRLAREFAPTAPLTIDEIRDRAAEIYLDTDAEDEKPSDIKTIDSLPKDSTLLDWDIDSQHKFRNYLLGRGLTKEEILMSKTHFVWRQSVIVKNDNGDEVGDVGRRVLWPVYGPNGSLVSWVARATDDREPKYLNCPDSEVNRTLWPFVPPHTGSVILVEGILDCIAVRRLGAPFSAYCTFGKKLNQDQMNHLKEWGVSEVILFWDPDAKKDIVKQVEDLKMQFDEVFVANFSEWPRDKDAGDMLKESDTIHIENAVCNPIDVNSMDYIKWQMRG
jgi:DNA primase